ncbi:MAG: cupredoxin domain-containing protein [Anaerolineae bacterium]|nr:cupredoxin domain-containing protein [Anaerolineae bacterium]
MKKSITLLVLFLLLSQILIACGGGGEPVTTIDVDMTEQKFTPDEFTVPAGAEITINIRNSGAEYHELTIKVLDAKVGEKFDKEGNSTEYWTVTANSGDAKTVTFTAPSEPGKYVVECGMPGHYQAGMVATLYVK